MPDVFTCFTCPIYTTPLRLRQYLFLHQVPSICPHFFYDLALIYLAVMKNCKLFPESVAFKTLKARFSSSYVCHNFVVSSVFEKCYALESLFSLKKTFGKSLDIVGRRCLT